MKYFVVSVGMFDLCIYSGLSVGFGSVSRLVFIVPDCIIMTRLVVTNYTNYILSPQNSCENLQVCLTVSVSRINQISACHWKHL